MDRTDADAILGFWFEEIGPDRWWTRSAETDRTIEDRFASLWEDERRLTAACFLSSPRAALAAILLFDQFSRNMFRGDARAFATDRQALEIAEGAIERGFDRTMSEDERHFLYMPFMHAESLPEQERAVALFEALGRAEPIEYARLHHAMIARFGRFPHRNAALGRDDRPGEAEAARESANW